MLFRGQFDVKVYMDHLVEAFEKEDAFRDNFVKNFKPEIHTVLVRNNSKPVLPLGLHSLTEEYALAVINTVSSVYDKDHSSPSYRLEEEIRSLQVLIAKNENYLKTPLSQIVFKKVSALVSESFLHVADLSPLGYQLLMTSLQWHHLSYMTNVQR